METNTNEALVQRVLQGDTVAFTELYQATHKRIYFLCIGFMKNEEDAKDALQETYLTAYQKLSQLTEREKFRSWLEQIAANTCKNMLKKKTPVPTENEDLESLLAEESELSLSEEYILNRDKRQVIMHILKEQLTDLQYQTVLLYYFEQLSVRETAAIMECSEAAVKNRLSLARSKIKSGVEQYENQHHDKLYSLTALPFLSALLSEEAKRAAAPDLGNTILQEITKQAIIGGTAGTIITGTGKAGGHVLQMKLLAGISAVIIAAGGAGAALHHFRQQETAELHIGETTFPEETTPPVREALTLPSETEPQEITEAPSEPTEALPVMQQYTMKMFTFSTDLTLFRPEVDHSEGYAFYLTEDEEADAWIGVFLADGWDLTDSDSDEQLLENFRGTYTELALSERTVNSMTARQINGVLLENASSCISNVFVDSGMGSILQISAMYPEKYTAIADAAMEEILQTVQCSDEFVGEVFTCPYFSAAEYGDWRMGYHDDNLVIFNNIEDGYGVCFDADASEGHLSPEITALEMLIDYRSMDFQVIKDEPSEFRGYEAYYQLFDSDAMYYEYLYFEVNGVLYTISWLMRPEKYEFYHDSAEKLIEQFTIITE